MKIHGREYDQKKIILAAANLLLVLVALGCFLGLSSLSRLLDSQREAERWQGESGKAFRQVSCYLPVDDKLSLDEVYKFRTDMQTKFHEAALDVDSDNALYVDAWSTTGKLEASTAIGSGEASVIAVGGEFFSFHPIRLLSGSYLSESDLMEDRVLLDQELSWLLFGGTDLEGMELRLNGVSFVVGGVIEREDDFASRKAYTSGMGLYMSYAAYSRLVEDAGISCYELTAEEPVDGFVLSMVREIFPIGQGEIRDNSGRYGFVSLLKSLSQFGSRSMQTLGVMYPYWENAARLVEDWSILLLLVGLAACVLPAVTAVTLLVRTLRQGKEKMEDDILPNAKDRLAEAIRVQQRRAWERRHARKEKEE